MGGSLILAAVVLRKLLSVLDQRHTDAAKQPAQK
jgi:hypothetical protein